MRRPLNFLVSLAMALAFTSTPVRSASVIKGQTWFPIGPAPISPTPYGNVAAGRASVLAVNPLNQNEVFLGAATGGVWRTVDAGLSWIPIGDNMPAMAIGAIALDPANCTAQGCTRLYVGTGENSLRRDTYYGRGLLIGTPAAGSGAWTWTPKGGSLFDLASINDVVLDPTTSGLTKRIYVAVSSGVTASASESTITGPAPAQGFGIYESNSDGSSWAKLSIANTTGSKPTDLEMDPQNSNLLFAGFLGKGIFKGVRNPVTDTFTWCPLNPGTGGAVCLGTTGLPDAGSSPFDFVEVTVFHPGGGSAVLYAIFGNCTDPICSFCNSRIYKSTDGGTTWSQQNAAAPDGYSRYTHVLTTHPSDHTKLLYGGIGLSLSYNSAASFQPAGNQHPDLHDVVFANPGAACTMQACNMGGNNCVIYAANDGGFYRSTDSGCTFTPRNDGLQITGFQSIAASADTPVVIGGTQDNGTVYFSGSSTWAHKTGNDSNGTVIDLDTPTKTYDVTGAICPNVQRDVERSTSGGSNTWWPKTFTTPANEAASFYPPLVQDPSQQHPLYLGTNRLYQSTNDAINFSQVSPALGGNQFFADIQRTNVITAIAVAPNKPARVYVGYYDGQIWLSKAGGPCSNMSCWDSIGGMGKGLPQTTVTWIAVDPTDFMTAYAAFSGFFSGPHLYKTTNAGSTWTAANGSGLTILPNVPVNTIAIEPSTPLNVWVGTDSAPAPYLTSVFKSTDGGMSWVKFGNGLPNVPVFELQILERKVQGKILGQVYAATHGRGAFILTQPNITNFEGWVNGGIWDIPVYGDGYPKNSTCEMQILQSDGTICAQGMIDARLGTMGTDGQGKLVSNSPNWSGQDVLWACFDGTCVNNVPIADCNDDETGDGIPDLLSTVLVKCGGVLGIDKVLGCPQQNNPPGSVLSLDQVLGGPVTASTAAPAGAAQQFGVLPIVQAANGATRVMCDETVPYTAGEPSADILTRARDLINADAACQVGGVSAVVTGLPQGQLDEDLIARPTLSVDAPGVLGSQIMLGMRAGAGEFAGTCFNLEGLGATVLKQILISRLKFSTLPTGASGGSIRLIEQSPLGSCQLTLPTAPGDTPAAIVKGFDAMFQAPGIPGPFPDCPSNRNPRDAVVHGGDSLIFVLATGLTLCVDDPGVGFLAVPDEVCFTDSDCDDHNPCSDDACDPGTHLCIHRPVQDGVPCQDTDPCTIGDVCRNGICGAPVICDDHNPCTIDWCDTATGRCTSQPLVCDDGDPCTSDFCNPDTGRCAIRLLPGAPCDDGDPCTAGDLCVPDPLGLTATCQGTALACNDGNPCTVDLCDPNTGQCVNSPLVCDDGNVCTRDSCDASAGGCVFTPLVGQPCNDGDLCTANDVCRQIVGGPVACVGTPVSCDDGNPCTADRCDPSTGACLSVPINCDDGNACTLDSCEAATGQCVHAPVQVSEPSPLNFRDPITIVWPPTPDATHWNTYRGTIPAKLLGSRLPASVYDQVCYESDDTGGNGATTAIDPTNPPLGTAFYYLTSGESACGESPIGEPSTPPGGVIPNTSPCPTPP